jgi:transposase
LLREPRADGQLWTGKLVGEWIGERVGRPVGDRRGWVYLRKLRMTLHRPRPRQVQTDAAAQAASRTTPVPR